MTQPTAPDLDAIETRAAGLYEYATGLDDAWQDEADQLAGTDVPALVELVRRLTAELATARKQAITDVGDWLHDIGEKGAAYLVRTVDIPAAEETHIVADDSDDPEHVDDCPGCTPVRP